MVKIVKRSIFESGIHGDALWDPSIASAKIIGDREQPWWVLLSMLKGSEIVEPVFT